MLAAPAGELWSVSLRKTKPRPRPLRAVLLSVPERTYRENGREYKDANFGAATRLYPLIT
jgi:hypothetical protein